jgi:hypothetical protein
MTIPFHCPIQPEEHVFSWLNRIHLLLGHLKLNYTLDFLGIENKPFKGLHHNQAFAGVIELCSREHNDLFSGIDAHSVMPLWSLSFESVFYQEQIRSNKILLPSGYDTKHYAFGNNWKYCQHCVEEDIKQYGHSFWHVKHQIPSITHCYRHNSLLIEDSVLLKDLRKASIPQAYDFKPEKLNDENAMLEWSLFLIKVFEIVSRTPIAGENLVNQVKEILSIPAEITLENNKIFEPIQQQFEKQVPSSLLSFLFHSYEADNGLSFRLFKNTLGYRTLQKYSIQFSHPICWLVILYWLRYEIAWDKCQ